MQKWYILLMRWTVGFLDDDVETALEAMPKEIVAGFPRIVDMKATVSRGCATQSEGHALDPPLEEFEGDPHPATDQRRPGRA